MLALIIAFLEGLTRTRPATQYFVQYPTQPNIEKPYPLGTAYSCSGAQGCFDSAKTFIFWVAPVIRK